MVLSLSKFCILTKITTTGIRTVQLFDFFAFLVQEKIQADLQIVSLNIKRGMSDTLLNDTL